MTVLCLQSRVRVLTYARPHGTTAGREPAGSPGASSSRGFVTMAKSLNLAGPQRLYLLRSNNIVHPDFQFPSLCYEDEPR